MSDSESQPPTPNAPTGPCWPAGEVLEVMAEEIPDNNLRRLAVKPPGTVDGSECWCQQLLKPEPPSCSNFARKKNFAGHVCDKCKEPAKEHLLPLRRVRLVQAGRDAPIKNSGKKYGLWNKGEDGVEYFVVNSSQGGRNAQAKAALIVVFQKEEHATRETCTKLFPQATQPDIPGDWLLDSTGTSLVVSVKFDTLVPVCPCHAPCCRHRA